ncbi:MAG: hypothetical protein V3T59_04485 [Desulfobacterales bacterium]
MVLPVVIVPMLPALMGIDGIVGNPSRMQRKPWIDSPSVIPARVIIPIIIVAIPGSQKQGIIKDV